MLTRCHIEHVKLCDYQETVQNYDLVSKVTVPIAMMLVGYWSDKCYKL